MNAKPVSVRRDDTIYFRGDSGPVWGRVICRGKDGVTVDCEGKRQQVRWSDFLGHRERVRPEFTVVDSGEDGSVVADAGGKRHYIAGELPRCDDAHEDEERADIVADLDKSLILDIGAVSACGTDIALEAMYKAASEPADEGIWAPHHDPYVRDHIESATAIGQSILIAIQDELLQRIGGKPVGVLAKAEPWYRWDAAAFERARAKLERKPTNEYSIDDWMLLIDFIVQRYLPDHVIDTEAEYVAARSVAIGRVQAAMESGETEPSDAKIASVVGRLPVTLAGVTPLVSDRQALAIVFARARAAELIRDVSERTRHRVKQVILGHEQARAMGERVTAGKLQQDLLDTFGALNRDWRRIALTETARNANEGYIASLEPGSRVQRVEVYRTACPFCRSIHGRILTVVSPGKASKDWDSEVWVGKTNEGRSAAPRRRVGNELVARQPGEMWTITAGPIHPSCRGTWRRVSDENPKMAPRFSKWLDEELERFHEQ